MKTNQILIRKMGNFNVLQRTCDGMFNGRIFIDDFNSEYKCSVRYEDYFDEECNFLREMGVLDIDDFLPYAIFVHLVYWVYPPLGDCAQFLCIDEEKSISIQSAVMDEKSMLFFKEYSSCKSMTKKELIFETYLMKDPNSGMIKIGKSSDVSKRHLSLSVGNPSLEIIMVIDRDVEAELHNSYIKNRYSGEWFRLSDDDLLDIYNKYKHKEPAV